MDRFHVLLKKNLFHIGIYFLFFSSLHSVMAQPSFPPPSKIPSLIQWMPQESKGAFVIQKVDVVLAQFPEFGEVITTQLNSFDIPSKINKGEISGLNLSKNGITAFLKGTVTLIPLILFFFTSEIILFSSFSSSFFLS